MSEYAPYRIGEIVIGQGFVKYPEKNGMECEIIGALKERESFSFITGEKYIGLQYRVAWSDGTRSIQKPVNLRRLPPKETPTTWEQVEALTGWNPGRVEA